MLSLPHDEDLPLLPAWKKYAVFSPAAQVLQSEMKALFPVGAGLERESARRS
ncbi:MAG: hypothetical protein HFF20_07225 [Oscillospiraceae bacterium]|nr:hypothetical protein [Oscillospiraceae bacterium]MCI9308576.1 hypothetical protein [Oscillospiraceae bacterium]MCI9549000.1 hypothetical protein [Oscillospiraceae bacterium]